MEYTKGDLVLVQSSYDPRQKRRYAIVQSQFFNSIKVKMIQTGNIKTYLKCFIAPVIVEVP
jgi:hypothetical protein